MSKISGMFSAQIPNEAAALRKTATFAAH